MVGILNNTYLRADFAFIMHSMNKGRDMSERITE